MLDAEGHPLAVYPYNEPVTLPIQPLRKPTDEWLTVPINLLGRQVMLRA